MTRINFMYELEDLNKEFISLGSLLKESFDQMVNAIDLLDKNIAREVIEHDDAFDKQEEKIASDCIALIVKQQPIAKDIRNIVATMRAAKEIEKLGDHCESICQYIIMLCKEKEVDTPDKLKDMIAMTNEVVFDAISNFTIKDLKKNDAIIEKNRQVDELFGVLRNELVDQMQKNPATVPQNIDYLMIARSIDRMANHAVNIARWLHYIVTGELVFHNN